MVSLSRVDTAMASLIAGGYTSGSLTDREMALLATKTAFGKTYADKARDQGYVKFPPLDAVVIPNVLDAQILADIPTAFYRLDETSGTVMNDSSGNGHHGTYVGGPTFGQTLLTDTSKKSIRLNGTTQRGWVAHGAWMDVPQFSFECIFNADNIAGARDVFGQQNTGIASRSFLRTDMGSGPSLQFHAWSGSAWNSIQKIPTSPLTRYHTIGTYDGSKLRLYRDGTEVAISGVVGVAASSGAGFGVGGSENGAELFGGLLGMCAFYNYCLTPARVAVHAALV